MSAMPYERPVLIRHQPGLMNKFGRVRAMEPQTHIEGVAVNDLVAQYGSPLFVFSERLIQDRYRELRDAFALRWPRVRLAWSYKTNYLDTVCTLFHREGAWAEVVSEFEYDKAMRMGVPPDHVHFNGPCKSRAVLERALPAGTIVHIDHFDELALCEEVAQATGCRPKVAIRVSLAAEGTPAWSRFGFNLDNGQAMDAARRILAGDRLELAGLHTHMGTFITEPGAYRDAARKLAAMANELRERFGVVLEFLDLGGGLASHNTLKAQYLPGDQAAPSFRAYADAVLEGLADLDAPPSELPTLVLESGRALIDDAGSLVSTVIANKRLPDGRRDLVVDAGVNILFTAFWYKHDLVPAQEFRDTLEPTVVHGPLCMNIDVVRDTLLFPPMRVGERVVFRNVGAYNVTQWMQFITYRPAVVLVGRDGRHGLMRRAEDLQAVVALEEVPEWVR